VNQEKFLKIEKKFPLSKKWTQGCSQKFTTGAEIIGPDGLYLPSKNNKLNSDAVHYYLPIDFPQNFTFACNSRRKFFEENYI
jgi:hypothetical protein